MGTAKQEVFYPERNLSCMLWS